MTRAAALLLLPALALAGCHKAPHKPTNEEMGVTNATTIVPTGWASVFGEPKAAIDAFGRVGLRPGSWQQTGPESYGSTSLPTLMSYTGAEHPNSSLFLLRGDASQVTSVIYRLDLTDPKNEEFAKEQFHQQLHLTLQKVGLPGEDAVSPAIDTEKPANGTIDGANYSVGTETLTGAAKGRRITITFTRPQAEAPGTRKPQGS